MPSLHHMLRRKVTAVLINMFFPVFTIDVYQKEHGQVSKPVKLETPHRQKWKENKQ